VSRVSDAIAQAGGPGGGTQRQIEIFEGGKTVRKVDLFRFWRLGDFDQNPMLREGQTVYVRLKAMQVRIFGEVRRPDRYEIIPGETVADLITYCGGLGPLGDTGRIVRERIVYGKALPLLTFPIESADTIALADMDIVVVPNIMAFGGANPVQVVGGGGRSGLIHVAKPEHLRDFLLRLGNFGLDLDLETAVLERRTGNGLETEQIRFNVREVIAGNPQGDMMVGPGDMVVIPPTEANVYVAGEVRVPGTVAFQPGFTADRYITLAGGPTDDGSIDKIRIFSRDGDERSGDRDTPIHRGDMIVVGVKTKRILGRIFVGITSLTSLVLSVVALVNATN
jgi:protein involved in polysaccharide export with SLBB domain